MRIAFKLLVGLLALVAILGIALVAGRLSAGGDHGR
jgi:hypothetical protein